MSIIANFEWTYSNVSASYALRLTISKALYSHILGIYVVLFDHLKIILKIIILNWIRDKIFGPIFEIFDFFKNVPENWNGSKKVIKKTYNFEKFHYRMCSFLLNLSILSISLKIEIALRSKKVPWMKFQFQKFILSSLISWIMKCL